MALFAPRAIFAHLGSFDDYYYAPGMNCHGRNGRLLLHIGYDNDGGNTSLVDEFEQRRSKHEKETSANRNSAGVRK